MKRAKREDGSDSTDRISELPKEMLQRILYFLSQQDAVRTSVLSKSWRYFWCTRPNLDFSEDTFKGNKQEFISVVNNSLQRYSDQRLCLDEFHLRLSTGDSVSLLERWIPVLTTVGVKEIHLSVSNDIYNNNNNMLVDLPSVVFTAESLKLLHLIKCNLFQKIPENIRFERLQILRLHDVLFGNEMFDKIISTCRFLETMSFIECKGLKTIKLEKKLHKHLKHFKFINFMTHKKEECSIEIDSLTLEKIVILGSKVRFHGHKFSKLKSLTLNWVDISSNSMEQSQICINAPSIEYFEYSGLPVSSISFTPTLRTSKLRLHIDDPDDAQSWFLRLSELLQALRRSKIYIRIDQFSRLLHIQEEIMNGGNKPVVVDHLKLNIYHLSSCPSFLYGLLNICRPRKISPWWRWRGWWEKEREVKELGELFNKFQMVMDGNHELEDLSIEACDASRLVWEPLQATSLLECAPLNINNLRFLLKWREACESQF